VEHEQGVVQRPPAEAGVALSYADGNGRGVPPGGLTDSLGDRARDVDGIRVQARERVYCGSIAARLQPHRIGRDKRLGENNQSGAVGRGFSCQRMHLGQRGLAIEEHRGGLYRADSNVWQLVAVSDSHSKPSLRSAVEGTYASCDT